MPTQPPPTRAAVEYVPWEGEVAPGIVQTKRDDLMMVFRYEGTDVDGVPQEQVDLISAQLEAALGQCDARVTVWCGASRKGAAEYPENSFTDVMAATLDDYWHQSLQRSGQFTNTHYLAFSLASRQTKGGFFDRVSVQLNAGRGIGDAVGFALKTTFSEAAMQAAFLSERDSDIQLLRDIAYGVLSGLPNLRYLELQGPDLREALKSLVSPASPRQPVRESRLDPMWDSYLPDNDLDFPGARVMRFRSTTESRHCAVLSLKDWPDSTVPGLIDALMALPCELTIAQTFKLIDQGAAEKYIQSRRAHNQQRKFSMTQVARAKLSGSSLGEEDADQGRVHNIGEANEALRVIRAERRVYGYYNITVAIFAQTMDAVEESVRMVDEVLRGAGYIPIRESVGLLAGFKATLPGMHSEIVRWHIANTGHYGDLAFTRTIAQGERRCAYFEEQMRRPAPALTVFPTEYATPYHFSPLVGQVGHQLIFGPTGAGKTVLTNFIDVQFMRYPGATIIRFDRDYSAFVTTMLTNGQHIDLYRGDVKLCPWKLAKNQHHHGWLTRFTKDLLTAHGYQWKSDDDQALRSAIEALGRMDASQIDITALEGVLSREWLRRELQPWMPGGSYGHLFGAEEDNFALSDNCCIEMGALLSDPIAAPRLVDYFFYLIDYRLSDATNQAPTLIDIQEASYFLADPLFAPRIDMALKTFRKKLASVIMSMQSVQSAAGSDIFASLGDNVPTRIFLPNPQAGTEQWRDVYRTTLGLNNAQIDRIAGAAKFRDYYLVRDGISRMLQFRAPLHVLAALRSDKRAIALCHELMPNDDAGRREWAWKERYINTLIKEM